MSQYSGLLPSTIPSGLPFGDASGLLGDFGGPLPDLSGDVQPFSFLDDGDLFGQGSAAREPAFKGSVFDQS